MLKLWAAAVEFARNLLLATNGFVDDENDCCCFCDGTDVAVVAFRLAPTLPIGRPLPGTTGEPSSGAQPPKDHLIASLLEIVLGKGVVGCIWPIGLVAIGCCLAAASVAMAKQQVTQISAPIWAALVERMLAFPNDRLCLAKDLLVVRVRVDSTMLESRIFVCSYVQVCVLCVIRLKYY